jgi:glucokinase
MDSCSNKTVLGIDIGGTHIKSAIVSNEGTLTDYSICSTSDWINAGDFTEELIRFIHKYVERGIAGCGIAIPGMVDYEGNCVTMVNSVPSLNNVCLRDKIQNYFPDLGIIVENDSNAAAYGEYFNTGEKDNKGLFFVTMGTGIGCGLILDGEIFRGGAGGAMELGQTLTDDNECLDDAIGIKEIERIVLQKKSQNTYCGGDTPHSIAEIIKLANLNDRFANDVMFQAGTVLGKSLVNMIWLFDVWNIAIGGGVAEAFPSIERGINHVFKQFFPAEFLNEIRLNKAAAGYNAGLIGAALLCFKKNKHIFASK